MDSPLDRDDPGDREYYNAMERHHVLGDDAFQNETTRRLFNAIDELKSCGANRDIENLPEIVIVGDQSVGKSSLLQSLTDIPFAVAGKLCTRFPTRIVSRRNITERTKVSIEPHFSFLSGLNETQEEREARWARLARYKDFEESYSVFTAQDFASVAEKASQYMQISEALLSKTEATSEPLCNFSEDILKIEIQGPRRSHFAILDLPGNFQSLTGGLVENDMRVVRNMVSHHMRSSQSVIVCVASGPTDLANQGVFDMASETDPEGKRTVGVITKCDVTQEPAEIVEIVKNETKPLHHGWFAVRNRNPSEVKDGISSQEHHQKEHEFFRSKPWDSIPQERRGTMALKKYLSNRLCAQYQTVFPTIQRSVRLKKRETEVALSTIGVTRETLAKKRAYLSDIASAFHSLILQSLLGQYGSVTKDTMKLRMNVREANDVFANTMKHGGHAVSFIEPLDPFYNLGSTLRSMNPPAGHRDLSNPPINENVSGPFGGPKSANVGLLCPTTRNGFVPYVWRESVASNLNSHSQSIGFTKPYSNFSFEELRLSDYMQNPKIPLAQAAKTSMADKSQISSPGSGTLFSNPASAVNTAATQSGFSTPLPAFGQSLFPTSSSSGFGGLSSAAPFGKTASAIPSKANQTATTPNGFFATNSTARGIFGSIETDKTTTAPSTLTASNSTVTPSFKFPSTKTTSQSNRTSIFGSILAGTKDTAEIYKWIRHEINASRGTELQGTLNPSVLPILFHKQAQKWRGLAEAHFINVRKSADVAVTQILEMVCKDDFTRQRIQASILESSRKQQESRSRSLTEHVNNILTKHLQTNNDAFEHKVKEARMKRFQAALRRYARSNSYQSNVSRNKMGDVLDGNPDAIAINLWDTGALFAEIHMSSQQNLEDDIHDLLQAYYEIARENFIEFVNLHVVERYLDDKEGPVFAFSPAFVGKLTDEEVENMAAEDEGKEKRRRDLEATLERLVKAEEIADRCMNTPIE